MNIETFVKKFYFNFKLKDFCINIFTVCDFPEFNLVDDILQVDPNIIQQYDEIYYPGKIFKNKDNFYFIKEISEDFHPIIESLDPPKGDRYLSKSDELTLTKDIVPNVKSSIQTTYGRFLINSVLLIDPFNDIIPYVNDSPIEISKVKDLIIEKVLTKLIDTSMLYRFFTNLDYMSSLCELFIPSISEKLLTINPEITKRKQELFEQYKDQLDDPVIMVKIEDELIKLDEDYTKDEDSIGFTTKKSFDIHRKRMFSTFGVIDPFGEEKDDFYFAKCNLDEGWDNEDLPHIFNEVRKGVYGRGIDTAKGGAATNDISRIFQDTQITSDDCKTKRGIKFYVDEDNKDQIIYRYIIDNGKTILLTNDNISKYINKTILLRSPMTCNIKDNFCYKCGDYLWEVKNLKLLNIIPVTITSAVLLISMKAMHGTKSKFYEADKLDNFLLK